MRPFASSARERLPFVWWRCEVRRAGCGTTRAMIFGMRRFRGACSDGSWPETIIASAGGEVTEPASHQAIWHEHTVKRSAFATIPAETRSFIIITAHPSLLLVALPCDSWLQSRRT